MVLKHAAQNAKGWEISCDTLIYCEIANKATAPTTDELHSIMHDINPYGRSWATPHTSIAMATSLNEVPVHDSVASGKLRLSQ